MRKKIRPVQQKSKQRQIGLGTAYFDSFVLHRQLRVGRKKKFGKGMEHARIREKSTAIVVSKLRTKKKGALRQRKDGKDADRDTWLQKKFHLREIKIDELLQVIDVLKGKLKPVGIRPLLREEYRILAPRLKKIYDEMGPGLLGLQYACKHYPPTEQEFIEVAEAFYKMWKRQPEKAYFVYGIKIFRNLRKRGGMQIPMEEIKNP